MANSESLYTLTETEESQHRVLAPAVGVYSDLPPQGTILTGGSLAGRLKILNHIYDLYLPKGIQGRVTTGNNHDLIFPVEYLQELFRLETVENILETGVGELSPANIEDESLGDSETGFLVKAFTTGIFYAKPSPDAPPFVEVGQEIEKGKAVGLIEVMKTFNHIIFQGTEHSDTGKVVKIYVKDSQEVKQGQSLFLIR